MVNYVAASDLAVAEPPEFAIDSLSFRAASSLCSLSIYKNIHCNRTKVTFHFA